MKHNLGIEGYAFRLRPTLYTDAPFIIELRSDPDLNRYLHPVSRHIEDQIVWLDQYYLRPNDYYFVIENCRTAIPEGLISIYDIDSSSACGEWGRWVLKHGSLAATESVWLIYRVAFELLKLNLIYCRTLVDNKKVISFHQACGITSSYLLKSHFEINGQLLDSIEHRLDNESWNHIEPKLNKLSALIARKLV